jgi:hypothetical protein
VNTKMGTMVNTTHVLVLVSCPDPTLEVGKGSGEVGHNPWSRERNLSALMRLQL